MKQRKAFLDSISTLVEEWHPTRNADLSPDKVCIGSEKTVWWLGKCGHEWEASISNRVKGQKCPYCSNHKVLIGYNDLSTTNPELAADWHPTKNCNCSPQMVTAGSGKKVWWKCKKGHEWQAVIADRKNGTGCPYCGNKRLLPGFNDLASVSPKLAQEWHPIRNGELYPSSILTGSAKKVWWLGKCGHEWEAKISERQNGTGCPYCANQKVLSGFNDLATINPQIAAEWHPLKNADLTASAVTSKSNKKVWWLGKCGHEWQATICNRSNGRGCPYCKNRIVLDRFNDLPSTNPKLAAEWHPTKNGLLTPNKITAGSAKKVWWLGECGHEWQAAIVERLNGKGCPFCSSERVLSGFNDLKTRNAELASEWHPTKNGNLLPDQIMAKSNKVVWWLGQCGHEWQSSVNNRSKGNGCPICARESQTSYPEQAIFYYLKKAFPDAINGDKRYKLEFDIYIPSKRIAVEYDGEFWHRSIEKDIRKNKLCEENNITLFRVREEGCPTLPSTENVFVCQANNTKSLQDAIIEMLRQLNISLPVNLAIDNAEIMALKYTNRVKNSVFSFSSKLAKEWHPSKNGALSPQAVYAGSGKAVWWQCDKGHEWQATPNSRTTNDVGCPYCSNKRVLAGYNDLATINPDLAKEWHPINNQGLSPQMVTAGSNKRVWWQCDKGHEWQASIANRSKGSRCPICCNQKVLVGFNDLATINPALASEWHPSRNHDLYPYSVTNKSNKKVWWLGKCGHEWQASIYERQKGTGCPFCDPSAAVKVINTDTQEVYSSYLAAAKSCGLSNGTSISLCCKGKLKTAGGYHWKTLL